MRPGLEDSSSNGVAVAIKGEKRRLLWHGMFLFLLGLLTGLVEQRFHNVRMGLAAHLEGILNGIFLVALGAAWTEVWLSRRPRKIAYWCALSGTYGNWLVTVSAAALGTAAMSPITAAGQEAVPSQELIVTLGFVSVGVAVLASTALLLWGLRKHAVSIDTSAVAP